MENVKSAIFVKILSDFAEQYGHCLSALESLPKTAMKAAAISLFEEIIRDYKICSPARTEKFQIDRNRFIGSTEYDHKILVQTNDGNTHEITFRKENYGWIIYENDKVVAPLEDIWYYAN